MSDTVSARFEHDVIILGRILGPTGIEMPASGIVNADVSPTAAIEASKSQKGLAINVSRSGTAVTETLIAHVVKGATGTLRHFTVSNVTENVGASVVTVDLLINGVSALAAVVTLDTATNDLGEEVGVLTTTAVVDGDVLTVAIVATQSGTDDLATGVFAQIDLDESYAL